MTTQYIYSDPKGRPEDQFVNFLIEQKVPAVEGPSRDRAHVEITVAAEVTAEEAGPWRSCDKGLCVEDLSEVCRVVISRAVSSGY